MGRLHWQPLAQKHWQGQLPYVEEQASGDQGQQQEQVQLEELVQLTEQVQLEEQEQLEELVQLTGQVQLQEQPPSHQASPDQKH